MSLGFFNLLRGRVGYTGTKGDTLGLSTKGSGTTPVPSLCLGARWFPGLSSRGLVRRPRSHRRPCHRTVPKVTVSEALPPLYPTAPDEGTVSLETLDRDVIKVCYKDYHIDDFPESGRVTETLNDA